MSSLLRVSCVCYICYYICYVYFEGYCFYICKLELLNGMMMMVLIAGEGGLRLLVLCSSLAVENEGVG